MIRRDLNSSVLRNNVSDETLYNRLAIPMPDYKIMIDIKNTSSIQIGNPGTSKNTYSKIKNSSFLENSSSDSLSEMELFIIDIQEV